MRRLLRRWGAKRWKARFRVVSQSGNFQLLKGKVGVDSRLARRDRPRHPDKFGFGTGGLGLRA